jgi:alpha-tubulin suppressor-like RCC1 family protein
MQAVASSSWPIVTNRELWAWGTTSASIGLGDDISRSSPVQVGTLTNWLQISAGAYTTLAIKTDGTLWGWGQAGNIYGVSAANSSSPIQIGLSQDWSTISTRSFSASGIKTDGTMWGMGRNDFGLLGLGDNNSRNSIIVQRGPLRTWKSVSSGGDLSYYSAAIKIDNTLWTCGQNNYGQLGLNILTTAHRSSPVQVGVLTTWQSIATNYHAVALKTDGTLSTWGKNDYGQLGQNLVTNTSAPVQIGIDTNWSSIAVGTDFSIALKTNGTLWVWGRNFYGQLGQTDVIDRSSPTQVGTLTTWLTITANYFSVLAIKTDGTLWGWGKNSEGQLAIGSTISRSSPTQIGVLTSWTDISLGGLNTTGFGYGLKKY